MENNRRYVTKKKTIPFKWILLIFTLLTICFCIYFILTKNKYRAYETTNLVLNNNNVTKDLENEIIIQDNQIYLSVQDIKRFFDKYLYKLEDENKYISTYDNNIAEIATDSNKYSINDEEKQLTTRVISANGTEYFPLSLLKDLYEIECEYTSSDNVVVKSNSRQLISYTVSKNTKLYNKYTGFKRVIEDVKKGSVVYKANKEDPSGKYIEVRTENGNVGYIKKELLENEIVVNSGYDTTVELGEKVNLVWDYFTQDQKVPTRSKTIEGVNVMSPSFFQLNDKGQIKINIGQEGKEYISWAKDNGYYVWPMFQNDTADGMEVTSKIMNSYTYRRNLIRSIVDLVQEYDLDGINIDFENMKKEDVDMFSRFIIELTPRMNKIGKIVSVDVTAPDGADTWSLCFDRNVIGHVANYIVFMAYDQYGASSTKPGTTAGYEWVELSLKKFIDYDAVSPQKIILGIPLYTRLWKTQDDKTTNQVVALSKIEKYEQYDSTYDEKTKQDYVEYENGNAKYQIWIENNESLRKKLSLVTQYDLAGVASWQYELANETIWEDIKSVLDN